MLATGRAAPGDLVARRHHPDARAAEDLRVIVSRRCQARRSWAALSRVPASTMTSPMSWSEPRGPDVRPGRHGRRALGRDPSISVAASSGTTALAAGGHTGAGHDPDRFARTDLTGERVSRRRRARPPATPNRDQPAGALRTRPSPRCRSAATTRSPRRRRRGPGRRSPTAQRRGIAPGLIWSRIQHRAASASIATAPSHGSLGRQSVISSPRRSRGDRRVQQAVRSPDSAALTRRLTSSARTSDSPAWTASRTSRATSSGDDFGTFRPAVMSVSMKPTWTATTWVRWASSSSRSELVSDHDAAFAAQYRALGGAASHDSTDKHVDDRSAAVVGQHGSERPAHRQRPEDVGVELALQLVHRIVGQHRRARCRCRRC